MVYCTLQCLPHFTACPCGSYVVSEVKLVCTAHLYYCIDLHVTTSLAVGCVAINSPVAIIIVSCTKTTITSCLHSKGRSPQIVKTTCTIHVGEPFTV